MQHITAELMPLYSVPVADAKLFIEWMDSVHKERNFDPDTLSYPRSCMSKAGTSDETLMMVPIQPVLFFESMAKKPGLSDMKTAACFFQIGEQLKRVMKDTGHAEAYFLTNSDDEADACERRGWKKVLYDPICKTHLMKLKLNRVTPTEAQHV